MAAEVVDKLTASNSSQLIMSSVLSTFAAEAAKNAGLSSTTSAPVDSAPNSLPKLDKQIPAPTNSYQSVLLPQQTLQKQSPSAQLHYYAQASGGIQNAYGYGGLPPFPMLPPRPPPMMHSLQQQPLGLVQQQPALPAQQQMMSSMQQPPVPPSFRPLQPPGMAYYVHSPQTR